MLRRLKSINQKGQASIEYVLVLVIVIMIGLGIVWKFNSAFRQFASSYFGQYLDCLLANGELPAIASSKPGACDAQFRPFDIANGRSPVNVGSSSGSSGDSSNSGGNNSSRNSQGSKDSNSGDKSEKDSSTSGNGAAGSSSNRSSQRNKSDNDGNPGGLGSESANSLRVAAPSAAGSSSKSPVSNSSAESDKERDGDSDKKVELADGAGGSGNSRFGSRADVGEGRLKYVPGGRQGRGDGGEETLRPEKVPSGDRDQANGDGRVPLGKGGRKVASEDLDGSLGLPDFLRYLIIAAIIIALVLFLGGQAVQVSKGQDSG